jgi:excinuclease ABC subunit C
LHLDGNGAGPFAANPGARLFGPYLGGSRVRLAVAGLHRVFPVSYASDRQAGALGDLARRRGIRPSDRAAFAGSLTAVLERDPAAVADLRVRLTERRDAAAAAQAYELAGRIHAELLAADWITCEQRAAVLNGDDADLAGWADGVLVRFDIRGGKICGWRQFSRTASQARRWIAGTPPAWQDFAAQNARLAASLRQAAGQPLS